MPSPPADGLRRRSASFSCSDAVEVCFPKDEGLRGAWFEARVTSVKCRRGSSKLHRYSVVFDTLVSDDTRGRPLRSLIPASCLRPRPPPPATVGLAVGVSADALWRDAWWIGVVTRVPTQPEEGGKYTLYFESTKEEMDFTASELRPHLDWIDRKWVAPALQNNLANLKDSCLSMSVNHKERLHATDSITESNDPLPEMSISSHPVDLSSSDLSKENSAFKVKRKSPYQKILLKKNKVPDFMTINEENIAEEAEKVFVDTTQTVGGSPHLKPCLVNKSSTLKCPLEDINMQTQEGKIMEHSALLEQKINNLVPSNSNKGSLCQDTNILVSETSNAEDRIESQCLKYDNQNSLINNDCSLEKVDCFQGAEMADSASKIQEDSFADRNAWMQHTSDKSSRNDEKPLTHEKLIEEPIEKFVQGREIHVDTCMKEMVVEETVNKVVVPSEIASHETSNITQLACFHEHEPSNGEIAPHQTASEEETFLDATIDATSLGAPISNIQDNKTRRVTLVEVPSNTSHQLTSGATDEISMSETKGLNIENCSLFTKKIHLWSVLGSMEVFSKFPQCPHFQPLEEQPEIYREGMAIGLAVTFSTAIENLKNLPISDSDVTLKHSLKTLIQLEEHGFDVRHVIGLIEKLLGLKGGRDQLLSKSSETQNLIHQQKNEVEKLIAEEELINKNISALLNSLALIHEKKVAVEQQQIACVIEMEKLESSAKEIKDKVAMMESKFEATISSEF